MLLLKVEVPVTERVEDRLVAPVTPKVEAIEVAPFRLTLPEPVVKVPVPVWIKLLAVNKPVALTAR